MCEKTKQNPEETPDRGNFRSIARMVMEDAKNEKPRFCATQQYYMAVRRGTTTDWPLGKTEIVVEF